MAELGWLGLIFPVKYGGSGGNILDLAVLMEEMGRACLPGPFFTTIVQSGLFILNSGSDEQKQDLLTRITDGKIIITLALTEPDASFDTTSISTQATSDNGDYVINGTKLFTPNAHTADFILCIARTKKTNVPETGLTAFLVNGKSPGLNIAVLKTIAKDKLCEVVFDNVRVPKDQIIGTVDQAWSPLQQTLQQAIIARCAEMVGGAQQVLEMSSEYSKQRIVFGRPLGSSQVIQQYVANMMIDVDGCRFLTYEAAWKSSEGLPCTKEIAMAKAWTSDAYRRVTATGHQIYGGIGYTTEHDMPLYFRRAKAAELTLGDGNYHREKLVQELGL
jgi:alkylation response protein AidB-like acyl-CoA dehydrogenase